MLDFIKNTIKPVSNALMFAHCSMPGYLLAAHDHHAQPDAPIGIMGYHLHPQGEWM